jgi:hypothetical protein
LQHDTRRLTHQPCEEVGMSASHSTNARQKLLARIMEQVRVDDATGCWVWLGTRTTCHMRYGQMSINDKARRVHRVMYELSVGPIPAGKFVLHECDNPLCCNPAHLFPGTHQDNMADMTRKDRQATGRKSGRHTKPERTARGSRNGRAKLTEQIASEIRRRYAVGGVRLKDLAIEFGVGTSTVWDIVSRRRWA